MGFDTPHRYDQAIDPSALTTIRSTLRAIEQGIADCRHAGVDPDTDLAVVLLARHLATVSTNAASDDVLHAACRRRLDAVQRFPALLSLAISGVAYDEVAKARFHKDAAEALRSLARHLQLDASEHEITSWRGDRSQAGAVTLLASHVSVTVRVGAPYEGREVIYRSIGRRREGRPHLAPIRALLAPDTLAATITGRLALPPPRETNPVSLITG